MIDPASFSSQLVAATRAGLDQQNSTQRTGVNNKINAFKAIDEKVDLLSDALKALSKESKLRATNTTLSAEGIVKASTSDGAIVGNYDIEVSQLAKADRIGLTFPENWVAPNEGSLKINVGQDPTDDTKSKFITLNLSDTNVLPSPANLMDLRNAINSAPDNPGVQASIVRTGSELKLVLSSEKTGTENQLGIELTGGDDTDAIYNKLKSEITLGTKNKLSIAQNAELKFNGIDITSQSNKVENITDKLTLDLITTTKAGEPVTLTVGRDDDAITESLESLVTAYNELASQAKTATLSKDGNRAVLSGDSTVSGMMQKLRSIFSTLPKDTYLSQVGLKFDRDGQMSLDKKALEKSLDNDPDVLNNMLLGTGGIVERLSTTLKPFSKSNGVLDKRVSSLNSEMDRLKDKTEQLDLQMDNLYKRYLKQFTAMQQLESQMQQTSGLFGDSSLF